MLQRYERSGAGRSGSWLPRLTWWQWVWYVVVVMASASAFQHMVDWLDDRLRPIPVLGWWPALISWPVLGGLFALVAHYGLPAREAARRPRVRRSCPSGCGYWQRLWRLRSPESRRAGGDGLLHHDPELTRNGVLQREADLEPVLAWLHGPAERLVRRRHRDGVAVNQPHDLRHGGNNICA